MPQKAKLAALLKQRKIRVYMGIDPTGARLHLGHAVGLRKLMEFASAGHEAIFLFGTGTVLVGDPSQRQSSRKAITKAEIRANIRSWRRQARKIVNFRKVRVMQNRRWIAGMSLESFIEIASQISAIQLFKRESFQNRLNKGGTVWYHETMYPILQGYDSVVLDVDLEIGGTDQEFNMLVGRELLKKIKNKQKYVLTLPLLMGTNGNKMSVTEGNAIWLDDSPDEMYGKLMSIPDDQITQYMELCTDLPKSQITRAKVAIKKGSNPITYKILIAKAVVEIYHGARAAKKAAENFDKQFSKGDLPDDVPKVKVGKKNWDVVELLVHLKLVSSKSEARRLIEQDGVKLNNLTLSNGSVNLKTGDIIRVGKRRIVKIS